MKQIEKDILHQLGFATNDKRSGYFDNFPLYFEGTTAFTINENYSFNCSREDLNFVDLLHVVFSTMINGDNPYINFKIAGYSLEVDRDCNCFIYSQDPIVEEFSGGLDRAIEWIESEIRLQSELEDIDDLPFPEDNEPITCPLEKLIAEWAVWCHRNKLKLVSLEEMHYFINKNNAQGSQFSDEQFKIINLFKKRLNEVTASL